MSNDKKHNPFAKQLADLDLDLSEASPADSEAKPRSDDSTPSKKPKEPSPAAPRLPPARDEPPGEDEQDLSDEELFQRAVEGIDKKRIYDAKFRGQAGADLPAEPDRKSEADTTDTKVRTAADEEEARRNIKHLRDAALFEKSVGPIDRLENRDKYYRRKPRPRKNDKAKRLARRRSLTTPTLPRQGEGLNYVPAPDATQRDVLKRYQRFATRNKVPMLHLRGDTRVEALDRLPQFIADQYRADVSFVRIIHGRGLRSEAEPVIKPTVLEWLEGPGLEFVRGYAPERTKAGDYGSLIVELRSENDKKG